MTLCVYNMPSTPSATSTFANNDTCRSSFFQVSSPTSSASLSSALTSEPNARRRDGEDVLSNIESSVSRVRDRVERLEDPMKVMKGLVGVLVGDSQMPGVSVMHIGRMNKMRTLRMVRPAFLLPFFQTNARAGCCLPCPPTPYDIRPEALLQMGVSLRN